MEIYTNNVITEETASNYDVSNRPKKANSEMVKLNAPELVKGIRDDILGIQTSLGSGHQTTISKYGADTLFSMVKTSLGIPTTAGESKNLIKDAFASEFKVGEYFDEFNPNQNAVIIYAYIFR